MTEIHEQAVEVAIKFEAKKNTLSQTQNGDWKINLVIQAIDMPDALTAAAMGQRFMCVMVALDEGEEPIKLAEKPKNNNVRHAATLCSDDQYYWYARHIVSSTPLDMPATKSHPEYAAIVMRSRLNIKSRSEVESGEAAIRFKNHVYAFNEWKRGQ